MQKILFTVICLFVALSASQSVAEEPLHQKIDRLIAARFQGSPAPKSTDAEFFRRIHLDLAGRIPSGEAVRKFLKDKSPDKRRATIDQLLSSPRYAERMTNLFHVMLMERRGDNKEWESFLRECFEKNKPWDQIVQEILIPNREEETLRGAAYFYTRRLEKVGQQTVDYPGLTRDVGRLFLGVDLQCAECHDHLFIDDYKQQDFQGLFAVYKNITIRKEKFPAINEATMTAKLDFASVFHGDKKSTGPRIPFGTEFEIPSPPPVDPAKKKKRPDPNAPPTFSALKLIAAELPSADNELFRQNIANRLWFVMMGTGLVEPLDQIHSANQASHPEVLKLLADELAAHHFDIKWMIRELVLTETWQRSSRLASDEKIPPRNSYQLGSQRRLTAEQLFDSLLQATGNHKDTLPKDDEESQKKLREFKARFLTAFVSEPKEPAIDYTPAVKQALFLLNDPNVLDLLKPQAGNLIERLEKLPDDKIAEELFLSIFSRMPDESERTAVLKYISKNKNRRVNALSQLAWAMLTSMEFCVNH